MLRSYSERLIDDAADFQRSYDAGTFEYRYGSPFPKTVRINIWRDQKHLHQGDLARTYCSTICICMQPAALIVVVQRVLRSIARSYWSVICSQMELAFKVRQSVHLGDAQRQSSAGGEAVRCSEGLGVIPHLVLCRPGELPAAPDGSIWILGHMNPERRIAT